MDGTLCSLSPIIASPQSISGKAYKQYFSFVFLRQGLTMLLCNPNWPRTGYTDQAALKPTEIYLPLPPECWDENHRLPQPANSFHFHENVLE